MNYTDPLLLDALAREYVLGTLRGPARRRFEGLLAAQLGARRAVRDWEGWLAPLAAGLPPVEPPARVWTRLATELGISARDRGREARTWQAIAAGLATVAVALGIFSATRPPQIQVKEVEVLRETVRETAREPAYVVVVADKAQKPVWLVSTFPELGELRVRTIQVAPVAPAESYELWMLPDDGTAPVSLGLLPEGGDKRLQLDPRRLAILAGSSTLAVSREPAGGSPTGAPTGPVLYTAPVIRNSG